MGKREFLQLAHDFNFKKHRCGGMFMSEKLDGQRCFWDGGMSRGLACSSVPFANIAKDTKERTATGLWSRYGKPVAAPEEWLDMLPNIPLDGELYTGMNDRQNCRSIVSKHSPITQDWMDQVEFYVFGSPPLNTVLRDGVINSQHFKKEFVGALEWLDWDKVDSFKGTTNFTDYYTDLCGLDIENKIVKILDQIKLPLQEEEARSVLLPFLDTISDNGGEGVMLQAPFSIWSPERSWNVLKVKKIADAEGIVTGYTWGVEGKEGKMLGLMGSLQLSWQGKKFNISGFTASERVMVYSDTGMGAAMVGCDNPGQIVQGSIHNPNYPIGSEVTFKYRGLTADGLPTEARFLRKYDNV